MYSPSSPDSIQGMFASIAKKYDTANTLLTFGIHKKWNKTLVRSLKSKEKLLDLCAGTGEIGFGFLKENPKSEAILLDFCPEMLEVAEKKGKQYLGRFTTIVGDAQNLPFEKNSVDAVSISYGIRNVKNPEACIKEVYRVLRNGGTFAILELTRPKFKILRLLHRLYLALFLPLLGMLTAKNIHAYRYLAKSVQTFVSPDLLSMQLQQNGFTRVKRKSLLGGVATLILAEKS